MADELKAQIAEHEQHAKNESLNPDLREWHRAQAIQKKAKQKSASGPSDDGNK